MEGHALVQQAERVSQGAVGRLGHIGERPVLHLDVFRPGQLPQVPGNGLQRDPFEIIALAP